jgi:hypothetical protein
LKLKGWWREALISDAPLSHLIPFKCPLTFFLNCDIIMHRGMLDTYRRKKRRKI